MARIGLALACGCVAALAAPAFAQDAAETAVVLSGSSGQAKAARSLGDAASRSMNSAASAVRASQPRRGRSSSNSRRNSSRGSSGGPVTIGTGDALEGTDASSYATGSGTTIRVSGGFRPSAATRCTDNCRDALEAEAETETETPAEPDE